jgi:hypothetical protein
MAICLTSHKSLTHLCHTAPRRCLFLVVVLIGALVPASAGATPQVKLHASFIPYRLGASTTVKFGFDIATATGAIPAPLTSIDLHLPAGLNKNSSELGLNICQPKALEELGPSGCPVNSQLGFGTAHVEATFGGAPVQVSADVSTFAGPSKSASEFLFYNEEKTPIRTRLVYLGQAREESGAFSSDLESTVPLIPTVPGGNDLATTSFESTLGPLGLTYYRNIHGRTVGFHPEGIILPKKCPAKGFPFLVELRFADGTKATGHSSVQCRHRG